MEGLKYKYESLYHHLKNQILNGTLKYGDKIPPENELASQFSLSRYTVRRAIELLTNEGLLEKRHGSGTFVKNTSTALNRSNVIGVITTYLDDYIFPSIIRGIETVLTQHGYSLSLGITENKTEKETACLRSMLDQNIDGLIIEGTKSTLVNPNIALLETIKSRNIPIVFINSNYPDFESSYVMMDDEGSGKMVADYLLDQGHRKIGGIFKLDDIQGHRRFRGIEKALYERHVPICEDSFIWYTTENMESIFRPEYDRLFLQRFKDISALICYNDQIAVKAMQTFERNGISVPSDISVVGFDNSDLCELSHVKLTSVTHARKDMGESAARTLLELMSKKKDDKSQIKIYLKSELIVRNSVKKYEPRIP